MKKAILILTILILSTPVAEACVGKNLNIGVIESAEGKVFSAMISTMINERTGTTVTAMFYKNEQELYEAIQMKKIDISIENTSRAMKLLNRPAEADAKKAYKTVKKAYEKEKGLIWLKPFGFKNGGSGSPSYTAAILRKDILTNFPALPRLINKLGSKVNDRSYTKLIRSVESGKEPERVAKDFLKSKKLI
jgi:osmoprotectant transport system substrate-binding protein